MPVKRRRFKGRSHRITPEVIEAFKAKDLWRLHRALGLKPYEYSPLTRAEIGGYGYPPEQEYGARCILQTRDQAIELRRQILDAIAEEDGEVRN
jgi:hypothetical protein